MIFQPQKTALWLIYLQLLLPSIARILTERTRIGGGERKHGIDARQLVAPAVAEQTREVRGATRNGFETIQRGGGDEPRFAHPHVGAAAVACAS